MSTSKTTNSKRSMALVLYDKEMLNLRLSRTSERNVAVNEQQPVRAEKKQTAEKYFRHIKSDTF